jgi:peptidyl-prolyl cis-trans isomerase C
VRASSGFPWVLTAALVASAARGGDADPVIAEVAGNTLRASDVERRLAAMPDYQRRTLGATPAEVRRRLVDTVLVPELRLAATAAPLATDPGVRARLRDSLRRLLVEDLRTAIAKETIPEPEIQAYYQAHLREFEQPFRIRVARILVDDETLAKKIIAESRGDQGLIRWKQLARDHSVDSATKMRGGILGFVAEDGTTEVPQLAVDKVLFAAASKVKDGELVPEPVREGERFAAVWRRGTSPKVSRSIDDARAHIMFLLREERLQKQVADVVARGRADSVKDENPALIDALPPDAPGDTPPPKPSGAPKAADPVPRPTDDGLR